MWDLDTIIKINNKGLDIEDRDLIKSENEPKIIENGNFKLLDELIDDLENALKTINQSLTETTPVTVYYPPKKLLELQTKAELNLEILKQFKSEFVSK